MNKISGINWNNKKKKWGAYLISNFMKINLGYFLNKIDAENGIKKALIRRGITPQE